MVIAYTTGDDIPVSKIVSASVGGNIVDIDSDTLFDEATRALEVVIYFRDPFTIKPGVKISFTITNEEMGDGRVSLTL